MKRQVVVVSWDDAHGSAHREVTEDDMPHRPVVMQTLGWLLRDDEKGVSLANELATDMDSTCYRGHTFVPRGMVRSMVPFNLVVPRTKKGADPITEPAP